MVRIPSGKTIAATFSGFETVSRCRVNMQEDALLPPHAEFTMLAASDTDHPQSANRMGHRLSKIVTRTGDTGSTGLGDGTRVPKDSARIEVIGAVDELNSAIGVLLAEPLPEAIGACLVEVQHDLFDVGGELSIPGYTAVRDAHVMRLEEQIDGMNAGFLLLKEFILPGGTRAASLAHVARTLCRRAERALVHLGSDAEVRDPLRKYVNRLSDLLFIVARILNREGGRGDVLWRKDRGRS